MMMNNILLCCVTFGILCGVYASPPSRRFTLMTVTWNGEYQKLSDDLAARLFPDSLFQQEPDILVFCGQEMGTAQNTNDNLATRIRKLRQGTYRALAHHDMTGSTKPGRLFKGKNPCNRQFIDVLVHSRVAEEDATTVRTNYNQKRTSMSGKGAVYQRLKVYRYNFVVMCAHLDAQTPVAREKHLDALVVRTACISSADSKACKTAIKLKDTAPTNYGRARTSITDAGIDALFLAGDLNHRLRLFNNVNAKNPCKPKKSLKNCVIADPSLFPPGTQPNQLIARSMVDIMMDPVQCDKMWRRLDTIDMNEVIANVGFICNSPTYLPTYKKNYQTPQQQQACTSLAINPDRPDRASLTTCYFDKPDRPITMKGLEMNLGWLDRACFVRYEMTTAVVITNDTTLPLVVESDHAPIAVTFTITPKAEEKEPTYDFKGFKMPIRYQVDQAPEEEANAIVSVNGVSQHDNGDVVPLDLTEQQEIQIEHKFEQQSMIADMSSTGGGVEAEEELDVHRPRAMLLQKIIKSND